jgi:hypothetical protein
MYRFEKISFLRCLDDPQFKCIIHKQSRSESGLSSDQKLRLKPNLDPNSKRKKNRIHNTEIRYVLIIHNAVEKPCFACRFCDRHRCGQCCRSEIFFFDSD